MDLCDLAQTLLNPETSVRKKLYVNAFLGDYIGGER